MQAVVYERYGLPEVLRLKDVSLPSPAAGQVLVKIAATSVNLSDWESLRGSPAYARIGGLRHPARRTLGSDVAGVVDDVGPGNDWRCVVTWQLPGSTATGSAIYQLDVTPDGRYVADGDGPQQVNGFFQVRTSTGDVPNPLWQFDGLVDLLTPTRKD